MTPITLSFDVTQALGPETTEGAQISIGAWLFLPAPGDMPEQPAVISLLNGGTYDKRYFHVEVPGRPGYSMAEHLAGLGNIVVLLDHLGISDSSRLPDEMKATRQVAALANHAAMSELYERLEAGTLVAGLAPIPKFLKVGGGHSMGGFQSITQQAEHRTYDRLLVLGYTAIGVHLTLNGKLVRADPGPLDSAKSGYILHDRAHTLDTCHLDTVPADVLAADVAMVVEVPYVLSTQSVTTGIVADDATRIDVPIYICLGERDVSPDPHAEPACYPASRDITLHILPDSGHCQNFANTRLEMYDRVHAWIGSISG